MCYNSDAVSGGQYEEQRVKRMSDPEVVRQQYRRTRNLSARSELHRLYSVNSYGWMRWVYDQYDWPPAPHVLELGCGPGGLWLSNLARVPEAAHITLTDASEGMVEAAARALGETGLPFAFRIVDAVDIPFADASYDVVIANHMLYHVPDLDQALGEIARVLRPGGRFYATTVGRRHMGELREIGEAVMNGPAPWAAMQPPHFYLEDGPRHAARYFDGVEVRRYADALVVTAAQPLVDYIMSMNTDGAYTTLEPTFASYIAERIATDDVIRITKDSGMVLGRKPPLERSHE